MKSESGIVPFNKPCMVGMELANIAEAVANGQLAGDGEFTKLCQKWLEESSGSRKVLLTHSCTAALEMSAMLCDLKEGDEVIMPSFTFVSTANAVAVRGARPVFVDIRPDTLNIDETQIGRAITGRTRAIMTVHYAGVACEMDTVLDIARKHGLRVIEDAAQGVKAFYKGRHLGTLGDLGCWSFHETKNFISGEGGAIAINDPGLVERAEIIREKGTNRSKMFRGEVSKYTWVDIGSSYLPSDLVAAFLYAQLEQSDMITAKRMAIFDRYHRGLAPLEKAGLLRLPVVPPECRHNAHMFYILVSGEPERNSLQAHLRSTGIDTVWHYVPLHLSPMAVRNGYGPARLPVTEDVSVRLLRLPCYLDLDPGDQDRIIEEIARHMEQRGG